MGNEQLRKLIIETANKGNDVNDIIKLINTLYDSIGVLNDRLIDLRSFKNG